VNFSRDGLSLWYGTPDAPAPADDQVPRAGAGLTIAVSPPNPLNAVKVLYRVDDGVLQSVPARELCTDHARHVQYFRVAFPRFVTGQRVRYCPVATCAGRQVPLTPEAERLPSTFKLEDRIPEPIVVPQPATSPAGRAAAPARFGVELEHLTHVTAQLDSPQIVGDTPLGFRLNFFAIGGTLIGPRLNGRMLPHSGDHLIVRRDGIAVIEVRATIETRDGATLAAEYYGNLDLGEDGYAKALAGIFPPTPPVVVAPRLLSGHASYLWLNRLQCIGAGFVHMSERRLEYDLYALRPREQVAASR
jgi:hypothetical protein